jgi:hypothetical protein
VVGSGVSFANIAGILFNDVVQAFDLPDPEAGSMFIVVAFDRRWVALLLSIVIFFGLSFCPIAAHS